MQLLASCGMGILPVRMDNILPAPLETSVPNTLAAHRVNDQTSSEFQC
ncbi:MAG: hypothetical protein HC879_14360 [Leptolyngbyaceae cyanobacterium SL_5_9]|nr:hypothetical protein [Leptolyngbyaceae cyanobacterium SL_5_9]NJO75643.1 hypothetical protein [Leptolyngbyaceae cyanobacterium RM1_406_9]